MASLVLGVAGAVIGSFFGSPQIGYAIGSMLGNAIGGSSSGNDSNRTVTGPRISDTKIQNSTFGLDIPSVYNLSRLAGNIIWSMPVKETKHTQTTSTSSGGGGGKGGGGGGGSKQTTTQITFTYSVDMAVAICRGPVTGGLRKIWANGMLIYSIEDGVGTDSITFHDGSETQLADSYIQSHNGVTYTPAYRGVCYVVFNTYQLARHGNSIPNFEFEIENGTNTLGQVVSLICQEAGLTPAEIDVTSLSEPILGYRVSNRGTPRQQLEPLATAFFFDAVESNNVVKFIKRGNPTLAATIQQDELDAREAGSEAGDLLATTRKMELELPYEVTVLYINIDDSFQQGRSPVARRLATKSRLQKKIEMPITMRAADSLTIANTVLHAEWIARTSHRLSLSRKYTYLEPTDVIDVVKNGLHFPMRLVTKEESRPGTVVFTAESEDSGIWNYAAPTSLNVPSLPTFFSSPPGSIRTPIIIDAPVTEAATGCELIVGACGNSVEWGGCRVWMSLDGTEYSVAGTLIGASQMGVTTTGLALHSDPDVVNSLGIDLSMSLGTVSSVSQEVYDAGITLCYFDDEMIAYRDTVLTAANRYTLSVLHRGIYTTEIKAHATAQPFLIIDGNVFRFSYLPSLVGKTIYLKFTSFNTHLLVEETLASVIEYPVVLKGPRTQGISSFVLAQPWSGRDVKAKWGDVVGADSFKMTVKNLTTTLRVVTGIRSNSFEYTYEDMMADTGGVPVRALTLVLLTEGIGSAPTTATLEITNAQVAAGDITGLSIQPGVGSFAVSFTLPGTTDYAGFKVVRGSVTGFDPATATVAYDGPGTATAILGLAQGTDYYIRIAGYDVFGKTGLSYSSEFLVTTLSAGGIPTLTSIPVNPEAIGGNLAFFFDTTVATQRGLWGWDSASLSWKFTRDGANFVAASIAADKLAVTSLSAISANLGAITAGSMTLDVAGFVKSATLANWGSGNGIYAGYSTNAYKFQVGNTAGEYLIWNGTNLFINSPQFFIGSGIAIFAGTLQVRSAASGARLEMYNNVIKVYDAAGTLRIKLGDLSAV